MSIIMKLTEEVSVKDVIDNIATIRNSRENKLQYVIRPKENKKLQYTIRMETEGGDLVLGILPGNDYSGYQKALSTANSIGFINMERHNDSLAEKTGSLELIVLGGHLSADHLNAVKKNLPIEKYVGSQYKDLESNQ